MELTVRARLRAGDHSAFGELFDQYAGVVYHHAYRLTGHWSVAEEAVATTFLQAWRLRNRIDLTGGSLRPWLLGIATNVVRNMLRKRRRESSALAGLALSAVTADFADDIAGRLDDADRLASVRRALGQLRTAEREVFALCVWAGLGYADAAEALGVPVGTVRSRLSRARRKLRALTDAPAEPHPGPRQVDGGRIPAARSTEEGAR